MTPRYLEMKRRNNNIIIPLDKTKFVQTVYFNARNKTLKREQLNNITSETMDH